jgi:hypothetical protein
MAVALKVLVGKGEEYHQEYLSINENIITLKRFSKQ